MSHSCEGILPADGYGEAIEACSEDDEGRLWTGNAEYSSQVGFCPYCGYRAHVMPSVNLTDFDNKNRRGENLQDEKRRLASIFVGLGYEVIEK
jgi:hypothetical protein